jgi:F-type H+-transporting ATPase subunit a
MFTIKPIMLLEWLDLVVRPSTLALRLLLVITADEMLRTAFLKICPALVPTAVMGFEVFIALVQAFVFTLLTSIYVGAAVAEHH